MKKLVVVGRGTAGSQAAAHFARWMPNCEIEWHFDPSISPWAVGEGSTLSLPSNLFDNLSFRHEDLKKIDGSFKTGIYKKNWGFSGDEYVHGFTPPSSSYHFNAVKLQNYIFEKLKDKVKIVEINHESSNDIDADFVMDCSGRPKNFKKHTESRYIAVNSVYVTQCFWDYAKFDYTLTIARPYGWVFGIPLQNRCSIGYLFNKDINSLDDIKEDVKNIFKEYNLIPSDTTNHFNFNSYMKHENFINNVAYNGNASFFLEPIEATSIEVMNKINRLTFDLWNNNIDNDSANNKYIEYMKETECIIMIHYFAGSIFKTNFWEFAIERGESCIKNNFKNSKFVEIINFALKQKNEWGSLPRRDLDYGGWWIGSFVQNIYGLGIHQKLSSFIPV